MGLFERILSSLSGKGAPAGGGRNFWFEVRCARCGERMRGRVHLRNDLSLRDDADGYLVRKTLIGSARCFNRVETTLYFDMNRAFLGGEIQGGEFVESKGESLTEG